MKANSLRYFYDQIGEFRTLMGLKTFWANPEQVELAKKAIAVQYLRLDIPKEEMESAAVAFDAVMIDFCRRSVMLGVLV
jgi:hypothetical protein